MRGCRTIRSVTSARARAAELRERSARWQQTLADGVADLAVDHGFWSAEMGEFLLPYDRLRHEDDPDGALLAFFTSVYEGSARLAGWDRQALEGDVPAGFAR